MPRECDCAGGCGPKPDGVSRRQFITLVGTGTAGAMLGAPSWAEWVAAQAPAEDLARWKADLHRPAPPRRYRSDLHTDARMHLGGIGTGNIEIGADGRLTTWQLFNTLRDGEVPCFFGVRAGDTAKILQTAGGPDAPRVLGIEMTGEYPLASLRFADADLPVQLSMTAFSPFAPLDERLSSMPVAVFVFQAHNPTARRQTVSLAAFLQNPVGYDAFGEIQGDRHPNFGGNRNESHAEGIARGLVMGATPGEPAALDRPVRIFTSVPVGSLNAPYPDRPATLTVEQVSGLPAAEQLEDAAHTVVWLEDPAEDLAADTLRAARAAVWAGATLLFAGRDVPLLRGYASVARGGAASAAQVPEDIVFEDFENGYPGWSVEGTAFGDTPAPGTLSGQQRVAGFRGKGLVNSFRGGDDATGRMLSKPFTIERSYIRFLVGGGSTSGTQVRLIVDGQPVRATSGRDEERLLPAQWDVRDLRGRTARIEIVDERQGGWGHINVDQIEFGDLAGDRAVLELLDELLPACFTDVRPAVAGDTASPYIGLKPVPGASESAGPGGLRLVTRPLGKGRVVLALGQVLHPEQAVLVGARQRAYAAVCSLVGARYTPPAGVPTAAPGFGEIALMALQRGATARPVVADLGEAWREFAENGAFAEQAAAPGPTPPGTTVGGAVAARVQLEPGQTIEVPFLLAWRYPNYYNRAGVKMDTHYAGLWPDVRAVVREAVESLGAMREKTERFRKTLYDTTLPYWLTDCLSSQAAIIRHAGVVFRIANGDIYGWEGSNGCCQPTCTHVWGYEQTLSRLFPGLEREMRRIDYKHQQRPDGGINNRTEVPSPPRPTGEQPFADGHASCVLKAYREALTAPDDGFLKEYWPNVKRAVDYLAQRDAATSGGEPNGVLEDDQWNTYDEALHGVTTFISGYYLAALRAGEEWARRMGDDATAARYRGIFEQGQKRLIEFCWNGEYFQQHLPGYEKLPGEVGPGCMSDQMIGQWWAHQLGLGYLFPREMVVSSLRSIFRYNWIPDLTDWRHMPRAFAGARDKGLIICTWPKGGRPPHVMLYSDEVWTGIEYQVAAHMVYEGLVDEGFAIVKGARDRYDGIPRPPIPRNPWNEVECGGHYARAMSSWSLLLALSGWLYDSPTGELRLGPRYTPESFRSFFCGPRAWGSVRQQRQGAAQQDEIAVEEGEITIRRLALSAPAGAEKARASVGGKAAAATATREGETLVLAFDTPILLGRGQSLKIELT